MEGLIRQPISKSSSSSLKLFISLSVVAIIGLVCIVSLQSTSPSVSEVELEIQEFKRFLTSFNKNYASSDFNHRLQVFKSNTAVIRAYNAFNDDVVLSVNKFADLSHEEFKSIYTRAHPPVKVINSPEVNFGVAPPPSWDWRDQGAVTDVGDQQNCTAGWAFAAVGAVEAAWYLAGNLLEDLSVQEVLDCTPEGSSNGCSGGLVSDALAFVQANNLTSDLIYPFIAYDMQCIPSNENKWVSTIASYSQTNPLRNSSALLMQVYATPVAAAVEADEYVWQFYNSGVVQRYCGTNTNHYVLLVGYNYTAGYWIAKNSWGQDWGESGYIRIGTGGGSNGVCGVNTNTFYANSTA